MIKCKNVKCIHNTTSQEDQTNGFCMLEIEEALAYPSYDVNGMCENKETLPVDPPTEEYKEYLKEFEEKLSEAEEQFKKDLDYEQTR